MCLFFFFNDTATTEIYTLSLHDALPILNFQKPLPHWPTTLGLILSMLMIILFPIMVMTWTRISLDRKSTRLNSSHANISYAVFCLKKKKNKQYELLRRNCRLTHKDYEPT